MDRVNKKHLVVSFDRRGDEIVPDCPVALITTEQYKELVDKGYIEYLLYGEHPARLELLGEEVKFERYGVALLARYTYTIGLENVDECAVLSEFSSRLGYKDVKNDASEDIYVPGREELIENIEANIKAEKKSKFAIVK